MLIGGAVVFRDHRGKRQFLLVKNSNEKGWEIPKITVRRGESSVRSVIRMMSEQGGMSVKVLEEAGRGSGAAVINAKPVSQKFYYYLMIQKGGSNDLIGFADFKWVQYADAIKKVELKKEKDIFRSGRDTLKEWEKTHSVKTLEM